MPELPEVELMSRNMQRWVAGASLSAFDVQDGRLVKLGDERLSSLVDQRVGRVYRRAKYTVMETTSSAVVFHFRMTGKLIPESRAKKSRLLMSFDNGFVASFTDTRRLGEVFVLPLDRVAAFFQAKNLGPEPYPERRDAGWWHHRVGASKRAIKPALMEQERVAGIGNILASELCFRAGILPTVAARSLTLAQWEQVADAWPGLIEEVLEHEAGDEIAYMGDGGHVEGTVFDVYGREGEPCVRCAKPIARAVQSGRSTFWCAACQR